MVIGCAKAERGQMAPLLELFAAQGHHVELVSGVDESRQRWREAGQRHGTRAVYVACGGPGLAAAQLTELRQELAPLGIPGTSIWTEVVDWTQLDRLVDAVDRMIDRAPPMVPAPPPLSSARTSPSSVPPPPPPSLLPAVGPSMVPAVAEGTIAPMLPPSPPRLAPLPPSPDASQVSLPPRPEVSSTLGSMEPMSSMEPMDSMDGRVGGWGRRVAWTLGTLAVAGLVGVVSLARPSHSAESDGAISDAAVQAPAGPRTPAAPRSSALASEAGGKPRVAAADATAERADAAASGRSPASEPGDAEPIAAGDDDAVVHTALMQRKIRALDILLVSPEATRKIKGRRYPRVLHTHWAGAQAYCEGLEIDGVTGWRLPTAGEFRTLGTSNMLGRRIYWSATEGDAFGSDRVVWNNQKKRMAPAPSTWKGGRVLCVRFQHPERVSPA